MEAFLAGDHEDRGRFGRGVGALVQGRVRADAVPVREALDAFRAIGTPWWTAKAIRVLETLGTASEAERTEAEAIEGRLGLVGPAR